MVKEQIKSGYKKTDIGLIPEDWEVVSLRDIASVCGGKRLPKGEILITIPNNHPYIRVVDMNSGKVCIKNIMYVPDNVYSKIKNYRIYSTDLFISVAGTLGIVGKVPKTLHGANLTENANRIYGIKINRDFLFYYLNSYYIQNYIKSIQTVGAQPKLALGRIEKFWLSVPNNKQEQKAIAKVLVDVDTLIDILKQLIQKKEDIKTATMQQLLTGKKRLPGFSGEWKEKNMVQDSYLKARIGWQGLTTAEYLETGNYILITGTDFKNGKINWSSCCYVEQERYIQDKNIQVKTGDILLTKDGTIGKVAYVDQLPEQATLNSGVFVIRPINDSYYPLYFYYILRSKIFTDFLNKLQAGSTINHLYQKDFIHFSFMTPPIPEQESIANILYDMDMEIELLQQRLQKTEYLKNGMMQELLTGKTRLYYNIS